MNILSTAIKNQKSRKAGESFLDVAVKEYGREQVDAAKSVLDIAKLFAAISVFWAFLINMDLLGLSKR